jgi:hypothetical protein
LPVLDPSGFQIAVIVKRSDVRFPLWVGGARRDDASIFVDPTVEFPDIPIVESVSIEIGMGLMAKIGIEIAAPYDLGVALLQSRLFTIGSIIEAQIGYPKISRFIPWFSAMQSKPSINLSQEEGLSATLNGEAGAFASMRNSSPRTYNGSYADIINEISKHESNNWTLSLPLPSGGDDALYTPREGVSQGNSPDWPFIMRLCRLANCDAYIAQDPQQAGRNRIVVLRRSDSMSEIPRFTFVSRGRADFINTYPLLEFESTAERVWLPANYGEVRASEIDPDTGAIIDARAGPETSGVTRAPGPAGAGDTPVRTDGTTAALRSLPRDDQDTGERIAPSARASATPQEVVSARSEEGQQGGGLNANMTSFGLPELLPGEVIRIEGAGIFNGNYGVETVQHRASAEEWTMSVKLLSNSLFSGESLETAMSLPWSPFGQQVNDQPPVQVPEAASGAATDVVDSEFADLTGIGGEPVDI